MTTATLGARVRPALDGVGRGIAALGRHPGRALVVLVAVQIGLALLLFARVAHNGWLTYQGGDQLWLVTSGWLLGQGTIAPAVVGPGLPVLLAPVTWVTGSSSLDLLPVTTVVFVGILGPLATLAVYDIGSRLAGRIAGLWCAAAVVVAPFVATPLFVDRYEERWTDQVLVQAVGFTQLADYPSTVLIVVAAALVLRSITASSGTPEAILAGAVAGVAFTMKPANAIFLAGPAVAYALARRWRVAAAMALAFAPALVTVALWKSRGLGTLPLLALEEVRLAASGAVGTLPVGGYFDRRFELDPWLENMSQLREFFFSARVAQWIPLAGAFAVARISRPAAGLLFGWVMAYFLVKGSSQVASIENASFWRLVMPALPAYVLLAASLPLLVPTLPQRLAPSLTPQPVGRRPGTRTAIAVAAVVGLVPLAVVLAGSPLRGTDDAVVANGILVPADSSVVSLAASKEGAGVRLRWSDTTSTTTPFYRILRTKAGEPDARCRRNGADRCELNMDVVATTRSRTWLDPTPVRGGIYRIGVAANWLDDPAQGDIMVVTPPVTTP